MTVARFFHVTLRTTDVPGAQSFYRTLLGDRPIEMWPLHEQAIARGARPHWLGFIEVEDVDRATAALVERGGMSLGPKWVNAAGLEASVVRDPGGALLALGKPLAGGAKAQGLDVSFFVLNTAHVERTKDTYRDLFGWAFEQPQDLGPHGVLHPFAWTAGGPRVGAMIDVAGRPGVHPHWLFHVDVAALAPAIDAVRAGGGIVAAELTTPDGDSIAVCDDPQLAAFALRQRA